MLCGARLPAVSGVYCLACYSVSLLCFNYPCTNTAHTKYHIFIVSLHIWQCKYSNKCFYIYFAASKLVKILLFNFKMHLWILGGVGRFPMCIVISFLSDELFFPSQSFLGGEEREGSFLCWPKPLVNVELMEVEVV